MIRVHFFYGMVVAATLVTFYFADVAPFGCCRGPYQNPQQEQPSQNTDEKSGEEQPKQGRLLPSSPTPSNKWAKMDVVNHQCVAKAEVFVCRDSRSL